VQGQRKGYKANAVFLFLVPCHSLFFEYPSLGGFYRLCFTARASAPSIKQIKTKTPLRRQWCLIVIED
ncbi:hypothetical protein, partial [Shigella dysenteriae]|uniref:hypothetical protein n=1 Tax=Shigella dysenteriae TaxID=622 RepID=UPI0019D476CB